MMQTHNEAYNGQSPQLYREILVPRELRSEDRFQAHFLFAEDGSPVCIDRFFDLVAERIATVEAA